MTQILKHTAYAAMAAAAALSATSCGTTPKATIKDTTALVLSFDRKGSQAANYIPRARVYRMSGPYAANVPVTLDAEGNILSYPAPGDISEATMPVDLGGGWWLDRRGVSTNTVFTRYTYAEYAAMKSAPTPAELKAAIIPGARVTALETLDMTTQEALADTAAIADSLRRLQPFRLKE